ncbi:acyltransferase [Corallococcus sp. M34]|uniref:acyltransferase family protein n=1 Tax=Citreicoccus inhibens TaxID=2849499 RepID=UPI001C220528|nr:acyltransferase [Citreicoccus inhibens]MBU8895494.1 acyltransferase [Citreicoccus inhibens]
MAQPLPAAPSPDERQSAEPTARLPGAESPAPASLRLPFLEGLRGLAALYVLNHHMLQTVGWTPPTPGVSAPWRHLVDLFVRGHSAVVVFIVLSGYCLMLPVVRSRRREMSGGWRTYLRRRARRILPPYYAAFAFSLLCVLPSFLLGRESGRHSFSPGNLVSHLTLVHNLFPEWVYATNGPLWSIATEWQIYFFFPFLLLPAWRRWGGAAAIGVGTAVGCALTWAFPSIHSAAPWFIGLFALGMVAAAINFPEHESPSWARVPWVWLAVGFGVGAEVLVYVCPQLNWYAPPGVERSPFHWVSDFVLALGTACLVVHCTRATTHGEGTASRWVRALTPRGLVALGGFSYSLYLVHVPLLIRVEQVGRALGLSSGGLYAFLALVGTPLIVVASRMFHRYFERPFLGAGPVASSSRAG